MATSEMMVVRNGRTGDILGGQIEEARGIWGSFKGLMFRKSIPDGYGLVFKPARGIHTNFMRFPIDLIFFDKSNRVTKVRPAMKPWRWDFTNAAGVIEMNPNSAASANIQPGDQLIFESPSA
jgi:uncharacterized membrane protein (UPF0127 family)